MWHMSHLIGCPTGLIETVRTPYSGLGGGSVVSFKYGKVFMFWPRLLRNNMFILEPG